MLEEEIRDYITGDSMKMKESKKPDHDDKGPTWQGHGNIQSIFRFAVNDINIGGKMSSGQKVIVWLGSTNLDDTISYGNIA